MLHFGHRLLSGQSCAQFRHGAKGDDDEETPGNRLARYRRARVSNPCWAKGKDKPAPSPLVSAIDRCRQITDATQRLACYDSAANALVSAANSGAVAVVDQNEIRKARHSLFGFTLPKIPFFSGDDTADEAQKQLEFDDHVGAGAQQWLLPRGDRRQ